MVTLKSVNAAIKARGGREQLVRGDGYHYFIGGVADELASYPSIYVCYTSHFTLEQWLSEWESMVAESKKQITELSGDAPSAGRFRIARA